MSWRGPLLVLCAIKHGLKIGSYASDGNIFCTSINDRGFVLWDAISWTRKSLHERYWSAASAIAISPDNQFVSCGLVKPFAVVVENLETGDQKSLYFHSNEITSIQFSPDGNLIASASKHNHIVVGTGREVLIVLVRSAIRGPSTTLHSPRMASY